MRIALKHTRLGLRNSTTRIAFRYGKACLTSCPQAVLGVTIEADGRRHAGYSGDCLPPGWFDKSPAKDFAEQIDDMLAVIALAEKTFREELAAPTAFFPAWMIAGERIHRRAAEWGLTPLLASFGVSLLERAMMDAMCRAHNVGFAAAARDNLFGIVPGDVHPRLGRFEPADWLPPEPRRWVHVRHTIGLGDALMSAEIAPDERLTDGFPQALEEYIERTGTRYFKIKLSNKLDHDLARLMAIARLIERRRGADYGVTLDGNELYASAEEFECVVEAIGAAPELVRLWNNTLAIEQPLDRRVALDRAQTRGIGELARRKPVIIDESDGTLDAYARAVELGYRGVSSKNCKGPIKCLLNAGLTWLLNDCGARNDYIMTGEDLCSVGIIPVQADLCLAATLGIEHVERNGHHYHPGLSYLPAAQRRAALAAHPDFYAERHGIVSPRVTDGKFEIGSLHCLGFGFAVEPDFDSMQPPGAWRE